MAGGVVRYNSITGKARTFVVKSGGPTVRLSDWVVDPADDRTETVGEAVVQAPGAGFGPVQIEYTQGIQYFPSYHPLGAIAPRKGDNAIPPVEGKTTVVRVYADVQDDSVERFGGRLGVRPLGSADDFRHFAPDTGLTVTARRRAEIDRGNIRHTLNFRLSGDVCAGTVETRLELDWEGAPATRMVDGVITFRPVGLLRLKVFLVAVTQTATRSNRETGFAAPTRDEAHEALSFLHRALPVAGIHVEFDTTTISSFAGNFESVPGDDPSGRDDPGTGFLELLARVTGEHGSDLELTREGFDTVYVALFDPGLRDLPGVGYSGLGASDQDPAEAPVPAGSTPEGWYGAPSFRLGDAVAHATAETVLHEVIHALGRPHSPGCNPFGAFDAAFPEYPGLPPASIGEYGIDLETLDVFAPEDTFDIMSYCGRRWISAYLYEKLMRRIEINARYPLFVP